MFSEINERLAEIKDRQRRKQKWKELLVQNQELLREERKKADKLHFILMKEEKDVQKLERISLTNVFYSLIGRKMEKLDQEKKEAITAGLKYEEAMETVKDIENEIKEIQEKLQEVARADNEYSNLLIEKEKLIHDQNTIWSEELFQLAEKEAKLSSELNEYNEAIVAGKATLSSLDQAIDSLDKAKGWATWDMIGGGFISTAIKHSHLDDAKRLIHTAQNKLRHFQNELVDIQKHFHIQFEIGNFLTFADYFFDGLIVDWVVRGRISDSLQQARNTRSSISTLVNNLDSQRKKLEHQYSQAKQQRIDILEKEM